MGWNEVDDKMKKKVDSYFVSCTEKYEIDYLKKVVKEEFPYNNDATIDQALKECCAEISAPRSRASF